MQMHIAGNPQKVDSLKRLLYSAIETPEQTSMEIDIPSPSQISENIVSSSLNLEGIDSLMNFDDLMNIPEDLSEDQKRIIYKDIIVYVI